MQLVWLLYRNAVERATKMNCSSSKSSWADVECMTGQAVRLCKAIASQLLAAKGQRSTRIKSQMALCRTKVPCCPAYSIQHPAASILGSQCQFRGIFGCRASHIPVNFALYAACRQLDHKVLHMFRMDAALIKQLKVERAP